MRPPTRSGAALATGAIATLAALLLWTRDGAPRPAIAPDAAPRAASAGVAARPPMPPPTENWLDRDAEKANKARRKAWLKERHRAPPGFDWVAVERQNGARQIAKRNALATAPPPPDASTGTWVERGSGNQAGRMHTARPSSDGSLLYAGSALGGVWKGTPDGEDWTPIADDLYGGAHWLAVLPPDSQAGPDVVLAGTDWGSLHRSADDGATWEVPTGLDGIAETRRLLVDGAGVVWIVWGASGRYALSRSVDGGQSFQDVRALGAGGDAWTPRDGAGPLWVADGDAVVRTDDGGETFVAVGDLGVGARYAWLVGSEAGAPRLFAVAQAQDGAYRLLVSDDAGATWASRATLDDFWGALEASAVDPELFAWGGVELHRSEDGGASAALVNSWWDYYEDPAGKLHADVMGVDVVPDGQGGEAWYVATDGGLYRSTDGLREVENLSLSGLRVSQYYGTLTSSADPAHVAAGAQDQGYQVTQGMDQDGGDVLAFDQILSGDYGHLTSGDGTHAIVFSVYPGILMVAEGEAQPAITAWLDFPEGETYGWLPTVVADPETPEDVYFGASKLYRYVRGRRGWEIELWSDQSFGRGWEYVGALAFSPLDPDRAWVATSAGRLFRSTDHGVTWDESDDEGPASHYFYGTAMVASREDADVVYVGGSGYDGPAVFRSRDGGATWEGWGDGLPATLVYSLAEARDGTGTMFAGTETAAYRRGPDDPAWVDITGADAPVTLYWSAEALPHENTIRFGTYGRGIWDYRMDGAVCGPELDADGDGSACDADCDDADGARFPGAVDACGDGLDADCDGEDPACVDEGGPIEGEGTGGGCGGCATGGTGGGGGIGAALVGLIAAVWGRRRGRTSSSGVSVRAKPGSIAPGARPRGTVSW